MTEPPGQLNPLGDLAAWEKSLTIRVGTAHVCRQCGSVVMVTRGGVGFLDLICCGTTMEQVQAGVDRRGGIEA